jgi:hypothetical protein
MENSERDMSGNFEGMQEYKNKYESLLAIKKDLEEKLIILRQKQKEKVQILF